MFRCRLRRMAPLLAAYDRRHSGEQKILQDCYGHAALEARKRRCAVVTCITGWQCADVSLSLETLPPPTFCIDCLGAARLRTTIRGQSRAVKHYCQPSITLSALDGIENPLGKGPGAGNNVGLFILLASPYPPTVLLFLPDLVGRNNVTT